MGCCLVVADQPTKPTKQLQPESPTSDIVTKSGYINYLLSHILSHPALTSTLHKSIFIQLQHDFNNNYWPDQKKTALIRLIQDYMNYTLRLVSDDKEKEKGDEKGEGEEGEERKGDEGGKGNQEGNSRYQEDSCFGEMFGRDVLMLENQVKMKAYWVLEVLGFADGFYKLNFDLRDQTEILKLASDVKFLCEKEMLSMFYLSSYLIKCCQKLRIQQVQIPQILKTLRQKSILLKNEYGVKGTRQKQQAYISRDNEADELQKIQSFNLNPPPHILTFSSDRPKEQQLEDQIINMVNIAKRNFNYFNDLVELACTQNQGFGFKSNLKLNSRDNKSALLRVKEKLLKKEIDRLAAMRDKNDIPQIKNCQTLFQRVKAEEQYVKNLMDEIYEKIQQVPFTVSDLLRGKCLFNKVAHINQAATKISQKISQQQKNGKNIELVQIDNRFQKNTKDLVLKIKIGQIVSEFQLVLFFKQAENQIDHKMYEIQRSKILSEISILYAWNRKICLEYFGLLLRILPYTYDQAKMDKCKQLMQFLGIDPQQFKQQPQQKQFNTNAASVLLSSKSTKIDKQKLKTSSKNCRLRSLQYLIEQKKQQKALQLYNLDQEQLKCDDQFVQSCQLNCIGSVYKAMNRSEDALKYYMDSLHIKKRVKGEDSLDCAQVLNNIGLVYVSIKQYESALMYYDKSLKIKQKVKGGDSIECAQTFNNIGLAYDRLKNNKQALSYYNKSLTIKQQLKGKDSIDCAQILGNIGLVYNNMNQNAEAIDYFSRALTIKEKQTGKDSLDCAQTLNNLGAVYKKMGKFVDALGYYSRALAIKEKIKGDSMDCAQTLGNIGSVYQSMKEYQKAKQYFSRSLEIKKKIKGQNSEQCIQMSKILENVISKIPCLDPNQITLVIPNKSPQNNESSHKYQLKTQQNEQQPEPNPTQINKTTLNEETI